MTTTLTTVNVQDDAKTARAKQMLDAALWYADTGYKVFPCKDNKKPHTIHGHLEATNDPDQIERWWMKYPGANIGIATAGLFILDVDGPDNPWLSDHSEWQESLLGVPFVISARGGKHYYFRRPTGKLWRCTESQLAHKIDTRTDGGYIIAPPSEFEGKPYRWAEGCALDVSPEELSEPPDWLIELLDRIVVGKGTHQVSDSTPLTTDSQIIPEGQRNGVLASYAGSMRHRGMSAKAIAAALLIVNQEQCDPPLLNYEVEAIATSVGRYPFSGNPSVPSNQTGIIIGTQPTLFQFRTYSSQELATTKFELNYLIDGLLVSGQPGIIAGPKKALKTNISIDLAISLSQGLPFLNYFPASKPTRVGVLSGESGMATIYETAKRIAVAKQIPLEECTYITWCDQVPDLTDPRHLVALLELINRDSLEVLILDPTYLMMLELGNDAANLFVVGKYLKAITDLVRATNCTPIFCHHFKKGVLEQYEPAELEHIAFAGFQEYMRQWILINRRVPYNPDRGGSHELWVSIGGSAGHSSLYGVNIEEGTRQDANGRRWEVEVMNEEEAIARRRGIKIETKVNQKKLIIDVEVQKRCQAAKEFLENYPDGETKTTIRDQGNVGGTYIDLVIKKLLGDQEIIPCKVRKNTRHEEAFKLVVSGRSRPP